MKISQVVAQLRQYCPGLSGRVAGGIDFEAVANSAKLNHPSAYVIAAADKAGDNDIDTGVRQAISDYFDVVLVMDSRDERGQEAVDLLHTFRAEIWRALIGWKPGPEYDLIEYEGGDLISINRSRTIYRFTFSSGFQLGRNTSEQPAETWHEYELDGLPPFAGMTINMDCIDPADPNLNTPGPDGRIEATFSGDVTP
ncbi:phage tail terminator protein [Pseudomonas sp.]|uniref:phage tail terminator protein n=1 Tax=Pseudomonas sp. TaxID=306 RepID=UPI003FD78E82